MNHPTRGNRIIFTKQEIGKIPTNGGPGGGWGGKQETLPKKTEKRKKKKKKEEVEAKTKIVVSVESGVLELRFGA